MTSEFGKLELRRALPADSRKDSADLSLLGNLSPREVGNATGGEEMIFKSMSYDKSTCGGISISDGSGMPYSGIDKAQETETTF